MASIIIAAGQVVTAFGNSAYLVAILMLKYGLLPLL